MSKQRSQLLVDKDIKATANRELVLEVFLSQNHALSLSDLEELLPWGDRASLFRTLKTFEKKGLIHQIKDGSPFTKYALCKEACESSHHLDIHPHFHCEACGKTVCLEKQEIIINSLPEGAILKNYSLIINGLCVSCQKQVNT